MPASTVPASLNRLPLVTLYVTERCNSRCVTCDYWRHGRVDMTAQSVARLLPSLAQLQTRVALMSGGEPLLNPEWAQIASLLKNGGLKLWLLTSGLSLAKHAGRAAQFFEAITVSLDGTDAETYAAIRGLNAFDAVCAGIRAVAATGVPVGVRVTVQRANDRQFPALIEVARRLGAHQVSFVAVDVANPHAFGRLDKFDGDLALTEEDLPVLERILAGLERDFAADFRCGFIAEKPQKLWRIHQYFAAVRGSAPYPAVRCNAPEFSAVISATHQVNPCFFIRGPANARLKEDLGSVLNDGPMSAQRQSIRSGGRPECTTCVCALWREPARRKVSDFLPDRRANA
ncbi:MAG: hypothetical protein NVS1B6_18650 [Steroidobacteraceae bacterium]